MRPERRGQRRNVAIEISGRTPVIELAVLNLSTSGMAIELSEALKVGTAYPFTMTQGRDKVAVDGNIQWCRFAGSVRIAQGEFRPIYKAGVSFTKIHTLEPAGIWSSLKTSTDLPSGAATSDG